MAAKIDIFEEMDPMFVTENRLQPMPPQLVAGGADQVDQVLTETQNVCCIKGWFIIAWRRLFQVGTEQRFKDSRAESE